MAKTKKRVFAFLPLFLTIALLAVFLITTQNLTFATTIEHTSFALMCREADAVVEATVQSKSSRIIPASGSFPDLIVTDVVLIDVVRLKGSRPNPLTITHLGGTVGSVSASVAGVPNFEIGERKIIFLDRDNALFGFWEGTFTIKEETPGVTVMERADGRLVKEEFDTSAGELIFHIPGERISKPAVFMEQSRFRGLIAEFTRNSPGGKQQFSE